MFSLKFQKIIQILRLRKNSDIHIKKCVLVLNRENYCIPRRHVYLVKLLSNHEATLSSKNLENLSSFEG